MDLKDFEVSSFDCNIRALKETDYDKFGVSEGSIAEAAKSLLPEDFDPSANVDVLPVVFNLAVVNEFNKNDSFSLNIIARTGWTTTNLINAIKNENSDLLILAVATEADINELDNFDDRKAFLDDIGLSEAGSSKLIKKSYDLLNLQTYFTAGVKEVRAWTINKGMTAPQAAGVIHTDFEKGFIRAEVISFKDYSEFKSEIKVKEAGKLNIEGKDYIVNDGDVMHFRFNV